MVSCRRLPTTGRTTCPHAHQENSSTKFFFFLNERSTKFITRELGLWIKRVYKKEWNERTFIRPLGPLQYELQRKMCMLDLVVFFEGKTLDFFQPFTFPTTTSLLKQNTVQDAYRNMQYHLIVERIKSQSARLSVKMLTKTLILSLKLKIVFFRTQTQYAKWYIKQKFL